MTPHKSLAIFAKQDMNQYTLHYLKPHAVEMHPSQAKFLADKLCNLTTWSKHSQLLDHTQLLLLLQMQCLKLSLDHISSNPRHLSK